MKVYINKKKILPLLILAMILVVLSGCKETDVLKEIIYDDNQPIVADQQAQDNNSDNIEKDENAADKEKNDDSEKETESQEKKGLQDETGDNKLQAVEANNNQTGLKSDDNDEANDDGDDDDLNNGTKSKNNAKITEGTGNKTKEETDNNQDGDADGTTVNPSNKPNDRKVQDPNGDYVDVPTKVDTVVAVGEGAVMVEMLGGSNRLVGTSESLKENGFACSVFKDLKNVKKWWSGKGAGTISSANFNKLLKADPDVCIINAGDEMFTAGQLNQLANKEIPCYYLTSMNTPENIQKNISGLGDLLGGTQGKTGYKNASKLARSYVQWIDDVDADAESTHFSGNAVTKYLFGNPEWNGKGLGQYTLFIKYWDDSAKVVIRRKEGTRLTSWSGGAPATEGGYANTPLSYYMSCAGVVNTAAAQSVEDGSYDSATNYWYVNQWPNGSGVVYIDGEYSHDYNAGAGPILTQAYKENSGFTGINIGLGRAGCFDQVVVANQTIADKVKSSKLTKYLKNGTYTYSDITMTTSEEGGYAVRINPYGVTSWYEGTVESPLEMYWTGYQFQQSLNITYNELSNQIKTFYKNFYDYDLSNNQVKNIINGKYAE